MERRIWIAGNEPKSARVIWICAQHTTNGKSGANATYAVEVSRWEECCLNLGGKTEERTFNAIMSEVFPDSEFSTDPLFLEVELSQ